MYFALLECIGQYQTGTFKLKISGVSGEADDKFERLSNRGGIWHAIPTIPIDTLAANCSTTPQKLKDIVAFCVSPGVKLFSRPIWMNLGILYSSGLKKRMDVKKDVLRSKVKPLPKKLDEILVRLKTFVRQRDNYCCVKCDKSTEQNHRSLDVIFITNFQSTVVDFWHKKNLDKERRCVAEASGQNSASNQISLLGLSRKCVSLCRKCSYQVVRAHAGQFVQHGIRDMVESGGHAGHEVDKDCRRVRKTMSSQPNSEDGKEIHVQINGKQ